jgi:dihydrofolate reductase
MRKIIVSLFITLDGVMQAPGGGEEAFKFGGWSAPYFDEVVDKVLEKQQQKPANLLLGRKTFEMFASFWPEHEDIWPGINDMTKYVMSNTMTTSDWQNSVFLKSLADIETIKKTDGPDLHVSGSGQLIQLLLKNDFVDELWLLIHPVTLGTGKKLFGEGTIPAAFTLTESVASPTGVIIANYKRAGEVKTGTVGA